MEISEGLQMLIDAALEDGKLTKKEKEVLFKRAEKDGLDLSEFELYMDSLLYKNKKSSKNDKTIASKVADKSGLFKETKGVGGFVKKGCLLYVYGFLAIGIVTGIYYIYVSSASNLKYGCSTVDDCLTIYEFEGARYVHEGSSDLKKIINAEAVYMVKNDEYERAIDIISEGRENFYSDDFRKLKFNIVEKIIENLLMNEDIESANKWVSRVCASCNADGQTKMDVIDYHGIGQKGSSGEDKKIEDYWDENETMDNVLLRKIENAKK